MNINMSSSAALCLPLHHLWTISTIFTWLENEPPTLHPHLNGEKSVSPYYWAQSHGGRGAGSYFGSGTNPHLPSPAASTPGYSSPTVPSLPRHATSPSFCPCATFLHYRIKGRHHSCHHLCQLGESSPFSPFLCPFWWMKCFVSDQMKDFMLKEKYLAFLFW